MLSRLLKAILPVCALLLSACGPQAAAVPVPTPSALPAPSPTSQPTPPPTPSPAPPSAPAALSGPPQVADALWTANPADGSLLLIDPADNSLAVVIPTGRSPSQVAVAAGYAWALDPANGLLIQVDARTYQIVREVAFPAYQLNALAVGAGAVWLGVTERAAPRVLRPKEEDTPAGGVLRIDPASGETAGYAKSAPVTALAASDGTVWALARGPVDTPLLRIDPRSLQVRPLQLSGTADWLLADAFMAGPDGLWLYSEGFGKLYHASLEGRLYREIFLGQHSPPGQAALLQAFGSVWLAAPWGQLLRIDPASGLVNAEIELPAPATALAAAPGALWAFSPAGAAAYRIDPASSQVSAQTALGSPAAPTPAPSPTAVRRATRPCEDSPLSRLAVGMRAEAPAQPALALRLHKEAAKDSELSGYVQPGQQVLVLEGPQCNENWVWWRVKASQSGANGWAAEGDALEYWLIPVP